MRFAQIDRILSLVRGESVKAVKCLSLSEEYLQDHFPRFPVMPGVLMLEAIFQASMYLVRASEDFQHSMVVLTEARNFKFQDFVQPGDQLIVTANWHSSRDATVKLKVEGEIEGRLAVSGWVVLEKFNLVDRGLGSSATDAYLILENKRKFGLLFNQMQPADSKLKNPSPTN